MGVNWNRDTDQTPAAAKDQSRPFHHWYSPAAMLF